MILKFIIFTLCAVSIIECARKRQSDVAADVDQELFNRAQLALSKLTEENASDELKQMIAAAKEDNTHWCCRIDLPNGVGTQTQLASYNFINSQNQRCGYSSCGFLGWSSCTRWCMTYWTETRYFVDQYNYYYQQQCPQEHLTCCTNFLYVLGHCLSLEELNGNLALIQQLQQEGVVIPGLTGK